jgi:DNA-binding transcriptional MocR family regulator
VAYVPGPPFHVGEHGRNTLRLSFSQLTEAELDAGVERLATVVVHALDEAPASRPALHG